MATESVATTTGSPISVMPPPPYNQAYWIVSEIFLVILTLLVFCLLFVVTCYFMRLDRRRATATTKTLLIMCIVSAVAALGRLVSDQVVAFRGWQSDIECKVSVSVSIGLYGCSVYPAYIFLWYRQNAFYSEKTLRHLMNKHLGVISKATLAFLALTGTTVTVLYLIPEITGWDYRATATGCRDANDEKDVELLPVLVILVTVLTQISLLGLLLYPLITTKKRQERTSSIYRPSPAATPATTPLPSRKASRKDNDLIKMAVMGATKRAGYEMSPKHRPSMDSAQGLYNLQSGFSSDNESIRSGSEAGFTSDATSYFTQSEYGETDEEGRPSTSHGTPRKKRYISTKDRHPNSRPGTPNRGRRGSGGSVSSLIWKKRKRSSSLKIERRKRSKSDIRKERKLKVLIRKVFFLCLICVFTDILVTVIQLLFVEAELAYLVLYDVNLFINILCIVLSFKEWKQILTAPFIKRFCPDRSGTHRHQPAVRRKHGEPASPVVSNDSQPTAHTHLGASLSNSSSLDASPAHRSVSVETGPFEVGKPASPDINTVRVPTPDIVIESAVV